jgi:hypothetical protein
LPSSDVTYSFPPGPKARLVGAGTFDQNSWPNPLGGMIARVI